MAGGGDTCSGLLESGRVRWGEQGRLRPLRPQLGGRLTLQFPLDPCCQPGSDWTEQRAEHRCVWVKEGRNHQQNLTQPQELGLRGCVRAQARQRSQGWARSSVLRKNQVTARAAFKNQVTGLVWKGFCWFVF